METGDLKNVVFFLVAIAAGVIQAAIKRKEAQKSGGQRRDATPGSPKAPPSVPQIEERDVVYGRRALPARYASMAAPAGAPPLPSSKAMSSRREASAQAGSSSTGASPPTGLGEGIAQRTLTLTDLDSRLRHTAAATVKRRGRGEHARRRLGISRLGGTRQALRAALRWNEILGPPHALRGRPHGLGGRPRLR